MTPTSDDALTAHDRALRDLRERVKELTALHETARLLQNASHDIRDPRTILDATAKLLPPAWQYPEVTEARLRYGEHEARTAGFRMTPWIQSTKSLTGGGKEISIEVAYLVERPHEAEGPFLAEERNLLESLSELLRSFFSRWESEEILHKVNEDLEKRVSERTEELRSLAAELALAEERQRRAIATDLHDHIGQTLAMVKMRLQELRGEQIFGSLYGRMGGVIELVNQAIGYTRTLTVELSPPILHELGLEAALEWLGTQMKQKYGFKVTVKREKRPVDLTDDLKSTLFRLVSELLTNAGKHAQATYILVTIRRDGPDLEISVGDNGRGFEPERAAAGRNKAFGLFSIRERLGYFGGHFKIESKPGAGTRAVIRIPVTSGVTA